MQSRFSGFKQHRALAIGVLLVMALNTSGIAGVPANAGGLSTVGRMHEMRGSHSATLLPNGKVLIAGGFKKVRVYDQAYFDSAELYDPRTMTFAPTGSLKVARCGHSATLLQDGKVLIAGGGGDQPVSSAEIYDPQTGTFALVGSMSVPRQGHAATVLKNGNVLITGGTADAGHSAEIFNVKTRRFESTGRMTALRQAHTATLLPDGRVLIAGGTSGEGENSHLVYAAAELYDPRTGRFTSTGAMTVKRHKHGALLLPDGTVLIAGGSDEQDWRGQYNTAELYDIGKGTFSRTADMEAKRFKISNSLVMLNDGTVLISGGAKMVEVFEPGRKSFSLVAQFEEPHFYSCSTLLPDGTVLITGGYNTVPQSTDQAWLYTR
jgi:WD40 repeat protein